MKTNTHVWSYLAQFFLEWETYLPKFLEKTETDLMFINVLLENRAVYNILWKNIIQPNRPKEKCNYTLMFV